MTTRSHIPIDVMQLIGRRKELFATDLQRYEKDISREIKGKRLLVYGGAGSIGKEVVKQIFGAPLLLEIFRVEDKLPRIDFSQPVLAMQIQFPNCQFCID